MCKVRLFSLTAKDYLLLDIEQRRVSKMSKRWVLSSDIWTLSNEEYQKCPKDGLEAAIFGHSMKK